MTYYAAGVLILAKRFDTIYALLGKDQYETYSDFGGKCEYHDKNIPIYTAAREMYEETCGVVMSISECKQYLKHAEVIHSLSYTNKRYYMYIIFIDYIDSVDSSFKLVDTFIKNLPFLGKFKEKNAIRWVSLHDIYNDKLPLRNVFKKTIQNHKNKILKIAYNYYSRNT